MHATYVVLNKVTMQTGVWLYAVHKTCAKPAAVYVAPAM